MARSQARWQKRRCCDGLGLFPLWLGPRPPKLRPSARSKPFRSARTCECGGGPNPTRSPVCSSQLRQRSHLALSCFVPLHPFAQNTIKHLHIFYFFVTKPFPLLRSKSTQTSRVSPADGNPLRVHLHLPQRQPQLAKRRRQVVVDYDLIKQMAVLDLHRLARPHHLLKVLLLRCTKQERKTGAEAEKTQRAEHTNQRPTFRLRICCTDKTLAAVNKRGDKYCEYKLHGL